MTRGEFSEWLSTQIGERQYNQDWDAFCANVLDKAAQVEPTMNSTAFALKGVVVLLNTMADDLMRKQGMDELLVMNEKEKEKGD